MIIVLTEDRNLETAEGIRQDLCGAFEGLAPSIALPTTLPDLGQEEWDDLLLVLFDGYPLSSEVQAFVVGYLQKHARRSAVLPIALDASHQRPPDPLANLKSLTYNEAARGRSGRLATRVGAILGLRPSRDDRKVFISYRATDGAVTADAFFRYLNAHGFNAWKDETPEGTNLLEGEDVQAQIEARIEKEADLLLVIDTPDALASPWMAKEIDLANANLVPVFPVCCRETNDRDRGSRFYSLRSLNRYHTLSNWTPARPPLEDQLADLLGELDRFISEMFQRRLKLPLLTRQAFEEKSFKWKDEDIKRALYSASRAIPNHFLQRMFLLHCSYLLSVAPVSLEALSQLSCRYRSERDFYIYDGMPLPMTEMKKIFQRARFEQGRVPFPVHINELRGRLDEIGGL